MVHFAQDAVLLEEPLSRRLSKITLVSVKQFIFLLQDQRFDPQKLIDAPLVAAGCTTLEIRDQLTVSN